LNLEEQRKLYLKPDGTPWVVQDTVGGADAKR
jgi:hypothetical protein